MLKNRPTSRVGTIEDSYYSIKNRIDMLEDEGKIRVKTLGESPDGKVTNEFHIYPNNRMESFTIYDYKFGFDPSDEEHFMEDYSFSVGGKSQNALKAAKALGFNVVSNNVNENENEEDVLGDWISDMLKYKSYDEVVKTVKKALRDALMDDELIAKVKANKKKKETPEIPGFEGTKDELDNLFEEEYQKRQWQHRAGIIK